MIRHWAGGTRFRLFPQFAEGYRDPETVELSPRPGSVGIGPSDQHSYVVDAVSKPQPYSPPDYVPPYKGKCLAPAEPGPDGHFDHIPVGTPQFLAAHLYGTMRRTLDVWERYLGHRVRWWHADEIPLLELIPVVEWQNAQSGPGFIETGLWPDDAGRMNPLSLNFDVIAHETGHSILFSQVGVPSADRLGEEYLAFQESFADMVGLVGALHFQSVIDRLLEQTGGNLYLLNLISRLGKVSAHNQLRIASNDTTMDMVAGITLMPDGSWHDPAGQHRNAHAVGEPLTGAIFDILLEIYQDNLVQSGFIPPQFDARGWTREEAELAEADVAAVASRSMRRFRGDFENAILTARDLVGHCMAHVMVTIEPDDLTFERVGARFLEAALQRGWGRLIADLLDCFLSRGIDPRPFMRLVPAPPSVRRAGLPASDSLIVNPAMRRTPCATCDPLLVIATRHLLQHRHSLVATHE